MNTISVKELKELMDSKTEFQLIDVREIQEVQLGNIGGEHIPMGEVLANLDKIRKDIPVVIHCRSGKRSGAVILSLENHHDYTNLANLTGGIIAWAESIDPSVAV